MNVKTKSIYKSLTNVMLGGLVRETWGFIKRGGGAQALEVRVAEFAWLKVENVLQGQISVIDLNHDMFINLLIVPWYKLLIYWLFCYFESTAAYL